MVSEAAIDLAGIVSHVTLVEFDRCCAPTRLLQRKLRSLPNVTILLSTLTTEVLGDGSKVTGLTYTDRTPTSRTPSTSEGVFVQIGLPPTPSGWTAASTCRRAERSSRRPRSDVCAGLVSPRVTATRFRSSRS